MTKEKTHLVYILSGTNKVSGRRLFIFIFIYKNHINFTFKIQINLHF
jgi:hypothetical protein